MGKLHKAGSMFVLMFCLALAGCYTTELAEVVLVRCEPRGRESDCRTVVEFPDLSRRWRSGMWGNVGDTIRVRLIGANKWQTP